MSDEYLEDVLPGNKKHRELLNQLREIEDDDYSYEYIKDNENQSTFLPSSMLKKRNKPEKKKKDKFLYDPDEYFEEMMQFKNGYMNKRKGNKDFYDLFNGDGILGGKKKKKKKKDENSKEINFKKEFEPEMALYRNLLIEQNRFTDTLQKEYDSITSVKSANRGVTKQMADLIENINDARSLSMQLVEKNVNAKKLIAELEMKQKKEFGIGLDTENMSDFASNYIKQMINERQNILLGTGDNTISEYTDDEMFDLISDTLNNDSTIERSEETELYLKYENRNVNIYVVITDDDVENYQFIAKDENDNVIEDYPLPGRTKISVNRSTNVATDTYGKRFSIIWV